MEIVLRVAVIYLFVMFGLRVIGKREFAQLTTLELVTIMLIPEIVSQALTREDASVAGALIGVSTLFCLVFFTSVLMQKSKKVEDVISDKPALLVAHGKFLEDSMNQERVTPGEVFNEMHRAGLERLEQVKWAVLESDGKISIIPEEAADRDKGVGADQEGVAA
jgi:Predicted membrane protein